MAVELKGKKIAFLAAEMFEEVELTKPWKALEQAGAELELVSLEDGEVQGFNHYEKAGSFKVDKTVEEASADDYDALVLPGGVGNPDNLRQDENAVTTCARTRTRCGSPATSSSRASRSGRSATHRGPSSKRA